MSRTGTARLAIFAAVFAALAPLAALAAAFTEGNLLVERLGDGSTTLSSAAFPIAILEVTTAGSLAQTISLPSSGSDRQTDAGTSTSHGFLNTYAGLVSVPGYDAAAGTGSVASSNTKVNSFLGVSGAVVERTLFPTSGSPLPFTGNSFRSSIATSGSTFYASGAGSSNTGGVWHYDGSAFTQLTSNTATAPTNVRNVEIYGNQLYFSSSSGTFLGISSLGTGLPTSLDQTATLRINIGAGANPYGFVMFDTTGDDVLDRAYVADDRGTNVAGGILRFDFDGTEWTQTGSAFRFNTTTGLLSGSTSGVVAIRGLAGVWDSVTSTATLFATTTETSNNRLISFDDTGSLSTSTPFTTLQQAGANYVFRGVDLTPVPEPSAFVPAVVGIAAAGFGIARRRTPRRPRRSA